jgi:hypothetical protein
MVDRGGHIEYSSTLDRWLSEARKAGSLPSDLELLYPWRWPGSDGKHPLEARRAKRHPSQKLEDGPHTGRVLTLAYIPLKSERISTTGEPVVDIRITGEWSDGKLFNQAPEPLLGVKQMQTVIGHMMRLTRTLRSQFPGARVRAVLAESDDT